jgi:hypothetical protein
MGRLSTVLKMALTGGGGGSGNRVPDGALIPTFTVVIANTKTDAAAPDILARMYVDLFFM